MTTHLIESTTNVHLTLPYTLQEIQHAIDWAHRERARKRACKKKAYQPTGRPIGRPKKTPALDDPPALQI